MSNDYPPKGFLQGVKWGGYLAMVVLAAVTIELWGWCAWLVVVAAVVVAVLGSAASDDLKAGKYE